MKVLISQPRYLPNVEYIERILMSDLFVVLDNVQRNSRFYENRNKLIDGKWLTLPIEGSSRQIIKDCKVVSGWNVDHLNIIKTKYSRYLNNEKNELLNELYLPIEKDSFLEIAMHQLFVIKNISDMYFPTILYGSATRITTNKDQFIFDVLNESNATEYICGPSYLGYVDQEFLPKCSIKVHTNELKLPWLHYYLTETL